MLNYRHLLFSAFLLACSACVQAQDLTEKAVKDLIAKADQASLNKDVNALAQLLSDTVEITVVLSAGGRTQKDKPTKAQFLALMRNGMSLMSNHTYRRSNENIVISGNVANVTSDIAEGAVMGGQYIRSRTRESLTIELVNGVPMITKLVGNTSM